jgi:hypothetical protein
MKSPFKDYPYLLEVPSFRGDYVDVWIREPFNPSRTNTFKCRKCGKNILWGKLNN